MAAVAYGRLVAWEGYKTNYYKNGYDIKSHNTVSWARGILTPSLISIPIYAVDLANLNRNMVDNNNTRRMRMTTTMGIRRSTDAPLSPAIPVMGISRGAFATALTRLLRTMLNHELESAT